MFPPKPFVMPQWDLNLVLNFLMYTPFEPHAQLLAKSPLLENSVPGGD